MNRFIRRLLPVFTLLYLGSVNAGGVYQEPEAFIAEAFNGAAPEVKVFWPDAELKQNMADILGHPYQGLRIRYWINGERSAWILDEIGKDKPITTGVVINRSHIEAVRVLVFRESRGWEVRHRFFTKQFDDASLRENRQLDRHIDNISGATLSVNALTKVARLALHLHQKVTTQ
ncbi:MAG: FMN-binding protein [Gammaproteobacteria bacterium]|nr:FMN-binding protein [Gammaproteobacteria bacterium]